jgi:hypothetical protein
VKTAITTVVILSFLLASPVWSYSGGSGTAGDPYRIATKADLLALGAATVDYGKYFVQTANISLSGSSFTTALIAPDTVNSDANWDFNGTPFTGVYDGAGYHITDGIFNGGNEARDYLGLFGKIGSGGQVKNLILDSMTINSSYNGTSVYSFCYGILCGGNAGTITNCIVNSGSIQCTGNAVRYGTFCGINEGIINNCQVFAASLTTHGWMYIGGFCGWNTGTITSCGWEFYPSVDAGTYGRSIGGFCAVNQGTLKYCYATGTIADEGDAANASYTDRIGGFCGWNYGGTIDSCYATGAVTGTYKVTAIGALVGDNTDAGIIRNSYATGAVSAGAGSVAVAGFCGRITGGSITNSFWDTQTTGLALGCNISGGTATTLYGKTTALMKTQSTFTAAGWQFVPNYEYRGAWYMYDSNHYPSLSWGPDQSRPFLVIQKTPEYSYQTLKLELTSTTSAFDDYPAAIFILQNGVKIAQANAFYNPLLPDDYGINRRNYYVTTYMNTPILPGVYDLAVSFWTYWPSPNYVLFKSALFVETTQAVSATASMQVQIEPAEAVAQGAQWQFNSGNWNDSGVICQSGAGTQTVQFKDLPLWKEPQQIETVVYPNQQIVQQVQYTPLDVYLVDQLRDMPVRHSDKLEFIVSGQSLTMTVLTGIGHNPAPANLPVLDVATGYFSYEPAAGDVFPFDIEFTGIQEGVPVEQTIAIFPTARLGREYINIQRNFNPIFGQTPIVQVYDQPAAYMNGVSKSKTYEVHIIGTELDSSVLATFNGRTDIRSISIYAEKLTLSQQIQIAQGDFTIYARELIFQPGGKINTSPINGQSPLVNADGMSAGDVILHCQSITNNAGSPILVLTGENAPGAGRGGAGGNVISTLPLTGAWINNQGGISAAGKYSIPGKSAVSGSVFEWLHPFLLKNVMAKARNLYLEEMYEQAFKILNEYSTWLVSYQNNYAAGFKQLPADMQRQLCQSQAEFDALATQLRRGLDYFGNPTDWAPMLSFEVNMLAFSQEVDRALSVFYLCRWVEEKNGSLLDQKNAIEPLRSQAMDRIQLLQEDYSVLVNQTIPAINEKLVAIGQQQYEKQQQLYALQISLTDTAKQIGNTKKLVFSCLKGASDGMAAGAKITSAFGSIEKVGFIFSALGAVEDVIGSTITKGVDIYKEITAYKPQNIEKYAGMSGQWAATLNGIDLTNVTTFLGTYTQNYQQLSFPASNEMGLSEDFIKKIRTPQDEVEKELQRLADQQLGPYLDDITQLMQQRMGYSQQLISEVSRAGAMAAEIGYNLTAIEQYDQARLELAGKLNPAVVQFVQDMKSRAKDALNKYVYYMARAYEYRMLKPYPGTINLAMLDDEIGNFTWDPKNAGWDTAMLSALKTAYKDDLNVVCNSIYDDYASSAKIERSSHAILELTPEEISLLNSGQKVQVNLVQRGLFFPQEEAVRITGINVRQSSTVSHIEGTSSGSEVCKIRVEHSGRSKFRFDGQVYAFSHYNSANQEPIYWQNKHITDGVAINEWYPENRSFASDSLLYTLLSRDGTQTVDPDRVMFYSRPAAWAELTISKQDMPGRTARVVYNSLAFDISYDYYTRTNSTVNVEISSTIAAHIKVSVADYNGRQDGSGEFIRIYPMMTSFGLEVNDPNAPAIIEANGTSQIVQVTAPVKWGLLTFEKWTDSLGNNYGITPTNPKQYVFLYNDISLVARYRQDFVSITGTVTDENGLGVPGLTLVDNNDQNAGLTDEYGNFNCVVEYGWSGTLRPVAVGKTFTPVSRTYTLMAENLDGQDFVIHGYQSLAAPEGLTASQGTHYNGIVLNWQSSGPNLLYRVYRSVSPQADPVPICNWQTGTTFVDTQCYQGRFYVYVVRVATDNLGHQASPYSLYDVGWLDEELNIADFNDDGFVNLTDFSIFAGTWLLDNGDTGYNDACDLQNNAAIDIADLKLFMENWLDGAF